MRLFQEENIINFYIKTDEKKIGTTDEQSNLKANIKLGKRNESFHFIKINYKKICNNSTFSNWMGRSDC